MDLMKIFEGYVRNFHTFQLTESHGRNSATFVEVEYFKKLGSMLGYWTFTEDTIDGSSRPMDLSWWDEYDAVSNSWKTLVLHLERENQFGKDEETLEKLFKQERTIQPENVIGMMTVRNKERMVELVELAESMFNVKQALLLFRLKNEEVHAYLLNGKKVTHRKANMTSFGDILWLYFDDEQTVPTDSLQLFSNDEKGYEKWLKANPNGYVFNFFNGSHSQAEMNKIHRANCTYLSRPSDEGRRTVLPKICSTDLKELLAEVVTRRGTSWSLCKHCEPSLS